MNRVLDIVMLIIMVPTALLLYFIEFPKKWMDRKYIFGVRNREEYKNENVISRINDISSGCRKIATLILIGGFIFMGIITLIPDAVLRMSIWSMFILAYIIIQMIPFARGNSEMKSFKNEIGIASKKGITYTDLKGAGAVHALKISQLIIPNVIGAVFFIAALLSDLGLIKLHGILPELDSNKTLMLSGFAGSFFFLGLLMIPVGLLTDRSRNEVISDDSDININYNRAKKKNWADINVAWVWSNTIFIMLSMILMFIWPEEMLFMAIYVAYLLLIMMGCFIFARKSLAIDRRYKKETTVEIDDDDNWLLGSIYYNPDDKRLNVEKRVGIGSTVNAAHPVGKSIYIISILVILGTYVSLVYVVLMSRTPLTLRVENGNVICHHMKDDYTIPISSIENPEIGEKTNELDLFRVYGTAMDPIEKGVYNVNGEKNCVVFLNLDSNNYITFKADGKVYYINGNNTEETQLIYQKLTD
jgi:hypothetical protein